MQNQNFIIQLLLILLPAETNAILKKKYYKKYAVRFFCSGNCKMVFILLTKIIAYYIIVTSINIQKMCLEEVFLRAFYSCGFGFHYGLNNFLYFLIWINSWQDFATSKSCCQCIKMLLEHCRYVQRPRN